MSNITYDVLWREAMMELLDQLEAESPADPALAPKDLADWSCIYIKYLQILRKLETAYDQLVHPQKRRDMRAALEAATGRLLEVAQTLVGLNGGRPWVSLDDLLVDLKLAPEVLEVPVPRYLTQDRAKELEDRRKFLEALIDKYGVAGLPPAGPFAPGAALAEEEAVLLVQCNERGRQARERARIMRGVKRARQLEDRRTKLGVPLSQLDAAVRIQARMRGCLARLRTRRAALQELAFLGMMPQAVAAAKDPQAAERRTCARRKGIQAEHAKEYEEAVVSLKAKVAELEGQDMREAVQDKINAWFIEKRDPETGAYPEFPEEEAGGSKIILNPPPPPPPVEEEANAGKSGKKDTKPAKPAKSAKKEEPKVEKPAEAGSQFLAAMEAAVARYCEKWQNRDESGNFAQRFDPELVKDELRPMVFEEVRAQVDLEMRATLQDLKDMVEAERAAKAGKKLKKAKAKKPKKAKAKGKEKAKKGRKDPTADRSLESLYAELVSNGIVQACRPGGLEAYLGAANLLAAHLDKAGTPPPPSMAQIRQAVTQACLLPLASRHLHAHAPHTRTMLLYGPPKCGKTLLTQAVAHAAGATFLNLSPRNTDGKYPGKSVALMVHMAFKVARVMAPSVIYIDEVEKVFVSDKKKTKEYGGTEAFSRIKKELVKEVKALEPGERVLVIGNSSEPWAAIKKDGKALTAFFERCLSLPLPDYASRQVLWPGLIQRHGGQLPHDFDVSTLAYISEGYASGAIDQVVRSMLTERRLSRLKVLPIDMPEILQWLCRADKPSKETLEALSAWTAQLADTSAGADTEEDASGSKNKSKETKGSKTGKK